MSCADLISDGWQPPPEEAPDFSIDAESGLTKVHFTGEVLVLDILADPDCFELPTIGPMLERAAADTFD